MPFLATTAPPCAPVVGKAAAELEADGDAPGTLASAPRFTWTCPAATTALAVAVTPNSDAILAPLAAAPAPYSTWVVGSAVVFEICPALNPSFTRAAETCPASPWVLPPLNTSTVVAAASAALTVAVAAGFGVDELEDTGAG